MSTTVDARADAARERRATRAMQAGVLGLLVVGLVRGNAAIVVNAVGAFAVTLLPAALARDLRVALAPGLTLWVAAAAFLHVAGMVALYDRVWWWDHLTHALSAALVAAAGYVAARVLDDLSEAVRFTPRFLTAFLFVLTMAFGVAWEVLEFLARDLARAYDLAPVLVIYGLGDTMLDLCFNTVGAALVAAFGRRDLGPTVETVAARLRERR